MLHVLVFFPYPYNGSFLASRLLPPSIGAHCPRLFSHVQMLTLPFHTVRHAFEAIGQRNVITSMSE